MKCFKQSKIDESLKKIILKERDAPDFETESYLHENGYNPDLDLKKFIDKKENPEIEDPQYYKIEFIRSLCQQAKHM